MYEVKVKVKAKINKKRKVSEKVEFDYKTNFDEENVYSVVKNTEKFGEHAQYFIKDR